MQVLTDHVAVLIFISMLGGTLLVASFVLVQIKNQNLLLSKNQELQDAELNNQKSILYATIASQEKERERIGMDLHDEVGAQLSWLRLMIENNNPAASQDFQRQEFTKQSKMLIDRIINNVRAIAHNLSPRIKDFISLLDSLHDTADRLNHAGPIEVILSADDTDMDMQLRGADALGLYRIITELLNNTIRHAGASQIALSLEHQGALLRICYADDGIGLPENYQSGAHGRGMQNIENRIQMMGGQSRIHEVAKGFSFQIDIPVGNSTP